MKELQILGGSALTGDIRVQGAKNAVLPILAATILAGGQVELRGCPHLKDVEASIRILEALGCTAWWEGNSLLVDTTTLTAHTISEELMRQMRSSAIFLGAILGRCGAAEMSYPGGCDAGWGIAFQQNKNKNFFILLLKKINLYCRIEPTNRKSSGNI